MTTHTTHQIVPGLPVLKITQIEGLGRMSKGDAFEHKTESYDYALPQDWLNHFADWCANNPQRCKGVNYDLIAGTTVWEYPDSVPCFGCAEVAYAFRRYVASQELV